MLRTQLAILALAAAPVFAGEPAGAAAQAKVARTIEIKVTPAGFEPREVRVKKGEATALVFTRVTDRTCITSIDIPDERISGFALPLGKAVTLTVTPKKAGVKAFHCSAMGMGNGKLIVEE